MNLTLPKTVQKPVRRPKDPRPNLVLTYHDPAYLAAVMVGDCFLSEYLHDPEMPLVTSLPSAIRQAMLLTRSTANVSVCVYDESGSELETLHAINHFQRTL